MKMRKSIVLLAAVFAVFAFTGIAMAQNRVEVKVTSEPISYQAVCDKAGGFSLEFDRNTTISVGDQITIDLSFIAPTDFAKICKAVNFEISPGGDAETLVANRWDVATIGNASTVSPFYFQSTVPTQVGDGIYFRVTAALNSQRITLDVMGTAGDSVTVGNVTADDKLILTLLDQKSNATDWTTDGIWIDGVDADLLYDDAATYADNTLCINVSAYTGSTVKGNMDSLADKYTFIPSDPQIAHVSSASIYSLAACTKSAPGRITCGTRGSVQGPDDNCTSFDFETDLGYVAGTNVGTNRLIVSSTSAYALANYQIKLEILVNGLTGDRGVYFTNLAVRADGYNDVAAACAVPDDNVAGDIDDLPIVGAQGSYTYVGGTPTGVVVAGAGSCDVALAARAHTLTTNESGLSLAAGNDVLMINIPTLKYDKDDISQDAVVSIRLTLIKAPCGLVFSPLTIEIGRMCAVVINQAPTVNTVVYPYFTAMANDNWWDGIVITNLSNATGLFTAMVYEQDGDVGKFTGTVDATGLYQNTLANALAGATLVSGAGTLGDSLCYILVCTNFTADGFAFMGSLSTNSLMANESMGYVPRVDYIADADNLTFCTTLGVTPGQ